MLRVEVHGTFKRKFNTGRDWDSGSPVVLNLTIRGIWM